MSEDRESDLPRPWIRWSIDDAEVLAQWLEVPLLLGAHVVELRGTLSVESRWLWRPHGRLLPTRTDLSHDDWRRAIEEANSRDGTCVEIEARELAREIVDTARRELGDEECEVEARGSSPRLPGSTAFRLNDRARSKILREALSIVGDVSDLHGSDPDLIARYNVLAQIVAALRADSNRLMKIADLLTAEEIRAIAEAAAIVTQRPPMPGSRL